MKETFIIRTEWFEAIQELKPVDQATVLNNLFHYHMGNSNLINLNNLQVKLVWKFIQPNLQRNIEEYDKRRQTSAENGKLGGRPKKKTQEPVENEPISEKEPENEESENNLNNLNKPSEKPNETKKPNETLSVFVPELDPVPVLVLDPEKKEIDIPFDVFWNLYDKKRGDKERLEKRWNNLSACVRKKIIDFIPRYIASQPDRKYRKDPQTFFNHKAWNDEIIGEQEHAIPLHAENGRALTPYEIDYERQKAEALARYNATKTANN